MDELAALQNAINVLHRLMTQLGDANATNVVGKCLAALTGLQKEMMTQQQGSAQQGVVQQLQGGSGGY